MYDSGILEMQTGLYLLIPTLIAYLTSFVVSLTLFLKERKKEDKKTKLKYYLITAIVCIVVCVIYLISLGEALCHYSRHKLLKSILSAVYITHPIAFALLLVLVVITAFKYFFKIKKLPIVILFILLSILTLAICVLSVIECRLLYIAFFLGGV